jgi:hypothetical protein
MLTLVITATLSFSLPPHLPTKRTGILILFRTGMPLACHFACSFYKAAPVLKAEAVASLAAEL